MLLLLNEFRDPGYHFAEEGDNQYDVKYVGRYSGLSENSG